MVKSGITRDELIAWGGPEVFNQALKLCNLNKVEAVGYNDSALLVHGKIRVGTWLMSSSFKLKPQGRIESRCPCEQNRKFGRICPHVVALGIALWVQELGVPNAEEPPKPTKNPETENPDEKPQYIEVPMRPRIEAKLFGSAAAIAIEVTARYGDVAFPACSLQSANCVYLSDEDDPLVRKVRSISFERAAMKELPQWGFDPGYSSDGTRLCITDRSRLRTFIGAGLPELRRKGWRVTLDDQLAAIVDDIPSIVPVIRIKDAPGGAFDVHYSFTAFGHAVPDTTVQAALNRGDGYLQVDNKLVLLDRGGIAAIREVFNDCAPSQNGAERGWFRVSGVYAPYVRNSLKMVDCDYKTTKAKYFKVLSRPHTPVDGIKLEPIPLGEMDAILRPYQKQGVYWLRFLESAGFSGLLADEMGLGKTIQTLAWLTLARSDPRGHDAKGRNLPALIVCPTSLVRNWEAEAQRFTPNLKSLVISGPDRANDFAKIPDADLVITSYALLQRDLETGYAGVDFSVVILDEAQHIKNRQTRNAQAVKGLRTVQRLVLTGTPIENSVSDVWSIFDFLLPNYLGEYEAFRDRFETPISSGEDADIVLERLKRKISPFILRRRKKMVAKDLPEKIIKVSYCPMSDDAQREYVKALGSTRKKAGSIIKEKGFTKSRFELLALLMKLRQIASRAKLDTFMDQLQQAIEGGHKILVFSQFVKMLGEIRSRLEEEGIPYCYLDGSTKNRLEQCNTFNRDRNIPVFLISLMAGGTGLNLTGADMVMHYDPWWNPAVEDQATDRAHRIGQKKNVYVMKMIASGTVEEKVLALQRRKQAIIAAAVDTTDAAIMEKLSVDDFKELLS